MRGQRDSSSQASDLESDALPLRHTPSCFVFPIRHSWSKHCWRAKRQSTRPLGHARHRALPCWPPIPSQAHIGRGESGWCSDWTSTPRAWRHAGAQFLLLGDWLVDLTKHGTLQDSCDRFLLVCLLSHIEVILLETGLASSLPCSSTASPLPGRLAIFRGALSSRSAT